MASRPDSDMSRQELLAELRTLRARLADLESPAVAPSLPAVAPENSPVHPAAARPPCRPQTERDAALTALLASTHDLVFAKDADGRYLMMSRAGADWAGTRADDVV